MALSNYRIHIERTCRRRDIHIDDIRFSERNIETSEGRPRSGKILSKTKGFAVNCEFPGIDLKVIRSMLSCGLRAEVDYVLRHKRRSVVKPQYIWDGIMKFGEITPNRVEDQTYHRVIDELREQFKVTDKIKPLSFREASTTIPQNTNPGFPFISIEPGKKKGEILKKYLNVLEQEWRDIGRDKNYILPDCAAYARTNISGPEKNKVRPVWTYPISVICAEAMFVTPLVQLMKQQKIFVNTAFGMEMMCGGMSFVNNMGLKAKHFDPGCKFIMTDYTSFDATVPAWLIRDCFAVIREKFDFSDDPVYYSRVFSKMVNYFINTPIRNPDGRRFLKTHGIPSGTMFTNIMGTMCNFVISRYLIYVTTNQDPLFDIYFGDDALICVPGSSMVNMDNISFQAKQTFGVNVSSEKSCWTTKLYNIHFLGYYNAAGTPYKTDLDLLAAMVYPQYNMDDWAYALARALGCVCASAGQNNAVLMTAQMVCYKASHIPGKVQEAERLVRENPRMARFFETMGISPTVVGIKMLFDVSLILPSQNCTKLEMGINLCNR